MYSRSAILANLRQKVQQGIPIIGGGAGTGISAKSEEAGGIDLIVIYNSGRYRMAGRGSLAGLLAYGNANDIVKEMAREVITAVKHTPGSRWGQRHRSLYVAASLFARTQGPRFCGRTKLSHSGAHRRHVPTKLRRDRDGL